MSAYPLEAARELRQRQEQTALHRLNQARRAREAVEARAHRLQTVREAARAALQEARAQPQTGRLWSAHEAAAHEQYAARLRGDLQRASAAYDALVAGALSAARMAEDEANRAYGEAQRARAALDRHEQVFREGERRARDRRDEDEAEEAARAARHHRTP